MVIKVSFEGSNFVVRNMTKGSPVKLLLAFALPLLVANVFQQLYSVADAMVLGRGVGVNALAAAAAVAGGVDNLAGVVKVVGFVSSRPDFYGQAGVINGASELFGEIFGSQHARSAVGVAALPLNVSVEVEAEFLIK